MYYSCVVYLSIPTSNHNFHRIGKRFVEVVYLSIPTSNHNVVAIVSPDALLYICLFLHQTTTFVKYNLFLVRCISVYSYIKPQRTDADRDRGQRCISVYSYIKPQLRRADTSTLKSCISVYSYIKPQHYQ